MDKKTDKHTLAIIASILVFILIGGLIASERRLTSVHKSLRFCSKETDLIIKDNKKMKRKLNIVIVALDNCHKS